MSRGRVAVLERALLLVGLALLVVGVAATDWRAGAVVAGLILVLLTLDLDAPGLRPRR